MRVIFGLLIAFALGATSTPTRADTPNAGTPAATDAAEAGTYEPIEVPRCRVFRVPDVGEICGFQFLDDWKAILRVDAELALRRAEVRALAMERDAQRDRADALSDALDVRERLVDELRVELADERRRLVELDAKYQNARGTGWGTWLGWGVATVAVSVLAGAVLADRL